MKLLLGLSLLTATSFTLASNVDKSQIFVELKGSNQSFQVEGVKRSEYLFKNYYLLNIDENNYEEIKAELQNNKNIKKVIENNRSSKKDLSYEDRGFRLTTDVETKTPFNDPMISNLWAFNDISKSGINVFKTYLNPLKMPKSEVIVAVVDTGIDYNHEDLKENMWVNEEELNGEAGVDDDGNGYVDDIHGINMLVKDANGNGTGNPMASHWHGTHVAGTIGAVQNNGIGIAGVAQNVKLMAVRAVPDSGDETDADVVKSFLYAAKMGAKVINCSFGKKVNEGGQIVSETIEEIKNTYGVLVVAAAGNDNINIDYRFRYPASFGNDSLLVVSSTEANFRYASYSNYGAKNSDIAAPGGGAWFNQIYSTKNGNSYGGAAGTSMASPHMAGVAAEVLSHFPSLSPLELKEILMKSIYDLNANLEAQEFNKGKETLTNGLTDLYLALQNAKAFVEKKEQEKNQEKTQTSEQTEDSQN